MKLRTQDRQYINHEDRIKRFITKCVISTSYYQSGTREGFTNDKGIKEYRWVNTDNFEILDDGLIKCLKCYSLMIPYVDDDKLIFFNKNNGAPHYVKRKMGNSYMNERRTGRRQVICKIDD